VLLNPSLFIRKVLIFLLLSLAFSTENLKPEIKKRSYCSAEALLHPKAAAGSPFGKVGASLPVRGCFAS
jgi:hypothetical protein